MEPLVFLQTDSLKTLANFCKVLGKKLSSLNWKVFNRKGWGHRNGTVAWKDVFKPKYLISICLHIIVELITQLIQAHRFLIFFPKNSSTWKKSDFFFERDALSS